MLAAAAIAGTLAALAPVVVHDSREELPLSSVAAADVAAPDRAKGHRAAVYGRAVASRGGGLWLQYWLYYPGQDQDRGILRTGRHEGDWEMVQIRVGRSGRPVEAVYAQHGGAERCGWDQVELRGDRPVVYVARGSHASYLRAGARDRVWPDPNDEADGRGRVVRPHLVPIGAERPAWLRWPGHWGEARARWWVPGEQDSPRGPAFQPDRWNNPDAWADRARGCQADCNSIDKCDTPETLLGTGGIVAMAAGAAALLWRRFRRRR
jgi:hypothetical protein